MKKNFKMMAVLSAAAVMTVAAPQFGLSGSANTAYAKTLGWVEEDDGWRYYEDEDYYLTDEWKKAGGDWFYLDEEGTIAFNTQVDEYYVNEQGKRVSNRWISIPNEDDWGSPDAPEYYWFYYGKNGKSVVSKWQTIDGKFYYFNEEGRMMTGLVDIEGETYYLGGHNDGVMRTGWVQLEDETDDPEASDSWRYFDKNGRMVKNQIDRKIDNAYYTFVDGRMQTGWFKLPAEETATPSEAQESKATAAGYHYYEESGKRASGWKTMEGIPGISEEGQEHTFYFKNGKPYFAENGLELFAIDSKKYAFNTKGEMQTGLKSVNLEDGTAANFYFGTDGVMQTGKQTIYDEESGENQNWFFYTDGSRRGQGFHGIRDNTIYQQGLRLEASADLRYAPVTHEGGRYLVNTNGAIQKASSSSKSSSRPELGTGFKDLKDANGHVWTVDVNGIIQ